MENKKNKSNSGKIFIIRFKGNKKGMLLAEETLKTVIAVIVIVFLVYFLVNLYFGKLKDDAIKSSEQMLISSDQSIKNIIGSLKEGESKNLILQRVSTFGDNWHLLSFTEIDEENPNACAGKNCLCICYDVPSEILKTQANECNKDGICAVVQNLKNEKINLELGEILTEILISKKENKIFITKK